MIKGFGHILLCPKQEIRPCALHLQSAYFKIREHVLTLLQGSQYLSIQNTNQPHSRLSNMRDVVNLNLGHLNLIATVNRVLM